MPRKNFLNRVGVYKLGPNRVYRDRLALLPSEQILYCFTSGAITSRRLVIGANWVQLQVFRPGIVYVRTDTGLFATRYRTLTGLLRQLEPSDFAAVHQSIVVNIPKILDIDLAARLKMLRVGNNGTTERLTISRRYLKSLLGKLGI